MSGNQASNSGSDKSNGFTPYEVNSKGTNSWVYFLPFDAPLMPYLTTRWHILSYHHTNIQQGNSYDNRTQSYKERSGKVIWWDTAEMKQDGSYYYKNGDNSTYYNDGKSATYTAPNGDVYKK